MDADKAKLEARRTKALRVMLVVSLVFAAFWLYDMRGGFYNLALDSIWRQIISPMLYGGMLWTLASAPISFWLTDKRNFIYFPTILIVNVLTVMAMLNALS